MSLESSKQVEAKRAMAQRARRLATGLLDADRDRLLRLADEQEVEADALEHKAESDGAR